MEITELNSVLGPYGMTYVSDIGEGRFGRCVLVFSKKYKQHFVVKIINRDQNSINENTYKKEVSVLSGIGHVNVVNIYNFFSAKNKFFIILEYVKLGSTDNIIHQNGPFKTPMKMREMIKQVLDGISFCHSMGIAHHDIKPANILLSDDGRVKLCDFGLACDEQISGNLCKNFVGSLCYMPPEVIKMVPHDPFKADIWSLGVTFYFFVTGELPFIGSTTDEMMKKFLSGFKELPDYVPDDVKQVIKSCIQYNPENRPTAGALLNMLNYEENKVFYLPRITGARSQARICSNTRPFYKLCEFGSLRTLPPLSRAKRMRF